jgi:hypothetical protein
MEWYLENLENKSTVNGNSDHLLFLVLSLLLAIRAVKADLEMNKSTTCLGLFRGQLASS